VSDYEDQVPFIEGEFADNPEPRCQCLLLLDTSASMQGQPIKQLNDGIITFKDELMADSLASKRVEICIINFGPPQVLNDWHTVDMFTPPVLEAANDTPMGAAIELAIQKVEERKLVYKQQGIAYYRPWIWLVSDGAPTDAWQQSATKIKAGEEGRKFAFFAVGVENADMFILSKIATRQPLRLKGLRFRDMFVWLSGSMSQISSSQIDDQIKLLNPATPQGWASL
jgi:uncharacterized protein YegL